MDLSDAAKSMYAAIARQEWEFVDKFRAEEPGAQPELLAWGLISDENRPALRDPEHAIKQKAHHARAAMRRSMDLIDQLPDLARELGRDYQAVQLRAAGGSSVYLADPAAVNASIQDVVGSAQREILAAQPGGPRKREILETAVSRDSAALDRGVELRTIYRDTVRDHALTAEYARTMSTRTGGRPAQYRTLVGDFERMVIVDREAAFVSDHIVAGSPPHAAWLVRDPAVVAVLASMFDAKWRRSQLWCGELRPRTGSGVDTVTGAGGVRTGRRQRAILRYLCDGESQATTARKMGISKRKLEEEIAVLKGLFGAQTVAQLTFSFGRSPDCVVDDSAPGQDGTGAVTTEAAERAEAAA